MGAQNQTVNHREFEDEYDEEECESEYQEREVERGQRYKGSRGNHRSVAGLSR